MRRRATNEMAFKNQQKKANQQYRRKIGSSQDAAVRKFFQETLHGPNFVCVCCRTLNFRHNVVIYDGKARVEIRKKANEAHEQEYNSKLKQVNDNFMITLIVPQWLNTPQSFIFFVSLGSNENC